MLKKIYVLFFLFFFITYAANAEENKINTQLDIITQYNPLGLAAIFDVSNQNVYHKDTSPLWNGLYFQEGVGVMATPSYLNGSIYFEWLPIAIFKLHLKYNASTYFGTYKHSFQTTNYSDAIRDDYKGNADKKGTSENILLQPTFRIKFNEIIIQNQTDISYYSFSGNEPYFLVNRYDLLIDKKDTIIANRTQILFDIKKGNKNNTLYLGPYYELINTDDTKLKSTRLGSIFIYLPNDKFKNLKNPRLYVQAGTYMEDPNRKNGFYICAVAGMNFDINYLK